MFGGKTFFYSTMNTTMVVGPSSSCFRVASFA